jgi:hypothetical protein
MTEPEKSYEDNYQPLMELLGQEDYRRLKNRPYLPLIHGTYHPSRTYRLFAPYSGVPVKPHAEEALQSCWLSWCSELEELGYFERAKELSAKENHEAGPAQDLDTGLDVEP